MLAFYSELAKRNEVVEKLCKSLPISSTNERQTEGIYLQLASDIGFICKRSRKDLNGFTVFSHVFYHQLFLEYFAAFKFNELLVAVEKSNELENWFLNYAAWDIGPFFYFLRSANHKLFEYIVKKRDWIRQASYALSTYSQMLLLNEEKYLFMDEWTLYGKSASNFVRTAIACKPNLKFWDCKMNALYGLIPTDQISATISLSLRRCKIDTTSLCSILSVPTLCSVEFEKLQLTDISNLLQLQFFECSFNKLNWDDKTNYDVFHALLANKHLQQNLKHLKICFHTSYSTDKFSVKLIQLLRLETFELWWFECTGSNDRCPLFIDKNCENPLALNLKKFKLTSGKVCQHMVEFLGTIASLTSVKLDGTLFENDSVKSDCEALLEKSKF